MRHGTPTSNRVVDLLRYKEARGAKTDDAVSQPRLDFDAGTFARVTPFRPLSSREIAHREQMVRHLARTISWR